MAERSENPDSSSRFGKFLLKQKLGAGGMAEVYLAETRGPDGFRRMVALKRILPSFSRDEEFIASFISEARLGGSLTHANIVPAVEFGREGDHYFIVMDYIDGLTLAHLLNHRRRQQALLPIPVVIDVARQLCDGLAYAHAARDHDGKPLKMVHRDLKPANVMLSQFGEVKITDFGVAKATSNLNQTTLDDPTVKGTLAYMSPEQAGCEEIDHRADLFSLGIILFEMITLRPLYPRATGLPGLGLVTNAKVEPQLATLEGQPPELIRVLRRLLQKERRERYGSASEVKRDLMAVLSRVPPSGTDLAEVVVAAVEARSRADSELPVVDPQLSSSGSAGGLSIKREVDELETDRSPSGKSGAVRLGGPGAAPGDVRSDSRGGQGRGGRADPGVDQLSYDQGRLASKGTSSLLSDVPLTDAGLARADASALLRVASRLDEFQRELAGGGERTDRVSSQDGDGRERAVLPSPVVQPGRNRMLAAVGLGVVLITAGALYALWPSEPPPVSPTEHLSEAPSTDNNAAKLPLTGGETEAPGLPGPPPITPAPTPVLEPAKPVVHPPKPGRLPPGSSVPTPTPKVIPPPRPIVKQDQAPRAMGTLSAASSPWSQVYIDGRRVGDTPLTTHPVPAGKHTIEFKDEDGKTLRQLNVEIKEGELTNLKTVRLGE